MNSLTLHSAIPKCGLLLAQGKPNDYSFLFVMAAIGVLFYFIIIRPEQRRRKVEQEKLGELKKNDRVVTIGGILGTVVNVQHKNELVIRIDDKNNTQMHILRTAVREVVNEDKPSD